MSLVRLNVGGRRFTTHADTLRKMPYFEHRELFLDAFAEEHDDVRAGILPPRRR